MHGVDFIRNSKSRTEPAGNLERKCFTRLKRGLCKSDKSKFNIAKAHVCQNKFVTVLIFHVEVIFT